ncbi:type II toxin-antitoxin system HicB family antitoxin [Achromobacter sp. GD03932]|uniref:type II toxin-antitoxin system HicB family antitoxin n=1 Tax=Achromobacter sp. GD03932 TaxID=2975407 RepID=UPI002447F5C8|nr:type II toxin-antitoxin system HicB family antitoxin [Achromobacter sp. GD03932]MDH1303487.1 type II toxin-antitoxin system HicB family antitoxin [Achromobacter sp. GD03932]
MAAGQAVVAQGGCGGGDAGGVAQYRVAGGRTRDTNDTWLVQFPDIPEALTVGQDVDEAAINAEEALEAALEIYFEARRPIPMPSKPAKGQASVTLPALVTSKVFLSNEMILQGVRKVDASIA